MTSKGLIAGVRSHFTRASLAALIVAAGCGDNTVTPPDAPPDAPPAPAALTMSPLTGSFGTVTVGETSTTVTFTVTNGGEATSGSISALASGDNAGDFNVTNGCATLDGGDSCTVTVTFTPSSDGPKAGNLVVSASPGGSVTATLSGNGVSPGSLSIQQQNTAFGAVVVGTTSSTVATFTVSNSGDAATGKLSIQPGGTDAGEFAIASDNCTTPASLAPGASCTITVDFRPLTQGAKSATFTISGNPGGQVVGSVSGQAVNASQIVIEPSLQPFGTVVVGQHSATVNFTVRNSGGVATSALGVPTFAGDTDFNLVGQDCSTVVLQPNNGNSCTLAVRFSPTNVNPPGKAGTVSVSATTGGTTSASLTGTAVDPGELVLEPVGPVAFGTVTVGQVSTSIIFTARNTGSAPLGPLSTSIGGTHNGDFRIVAGSDGCQGVTLAGSQSCDVTLEFVPTAGGNRVANFTVTHTGGLAQQVIEGVGVAPARLDICNGTLPCLVGSLASQDFGSVVTGTSSAPQNFTITNNGGVVTSNILESITGANASQFTLAGNCTTLDPGESCTVQVTYNASTVGDVSASLDFSAQPNGGNKSAALSGRGIAAAQLVVSPTIINFVGNGFNGSTTIGDSTGPTLATSFTVTNQGAQTTGTLSITATNPEFTFTHNCTVLVQNASCTVNVTFSPANRDFRTGSIVVTGAPGGEAAVTVQGLALPRLELISTNGTPVQNPYPFPDTVVDPDSPPTLTLQFRNNRAVGTNVTQTEVDPGNDFDLVSSDCTAGTPDLTPGEVCTVVFEFDPNLPIAPKAGSFSLTVQGSTNPVDVVTANFTGTPTIDTLVITDIIAGQPDTTPSTPTSHDFGNVAVGSSSAGRTFRLSNISDDPTGVLTVSLDGEGFQIATNGCNTGGGNGGGTLTDNETCDIVIVFTPTAETAQSATLTVTTSTGSPTLGGTVTATVTGTGVAPVAAFAPDSVDFGTVFAGTNPATVTQTVTVRNPNDSATTLTFSITDDSQTLNFNSAGIPQPDGTQFARAGGTCPSSGGTVAAAATCTIVLTFNADLDPARPSPFTGSRFGVLTLSESFGGNSAIIPLTGVVRSTLSITTAPPVFTNVVVGQQVQVSVTVLNESTQTLGNFPVARVVTNLAQYGVIGNTCPTGAPSLAPGATCSFTLVYQPTAAGDHSTEVITLGGIAGVTTGVVTQVVTANAITPANLVVDQASYDFGFTLSGQIGVTRTFRYTNSGQQATGALVVALPPGETDYTLDAAGCQGIVLAFGESCTVSVRFNPQTAANHALNPGLTATATPGGTASTQFIAVGTALGGVTASPAAFAFGATTQGTTNPTFQDFVLENSNAGPLPLIATITGTNNAEFVRDATVANNCGATLGGGQSCVIRLRFSPALVAVGVRVAQLNVDGVAYVPLTGTALTIASLAASPGVFNFGVQTLNTDSAVQNIVVTNSGQTASGSITVTTAGTDLAHYIINITGCNGQSLAPGASCTVTVIFHPLDSSVTAKLASVSFAASQAPGAAYSQTVNLTGIGVDPAALSITPNPGPNDGNRAIGDLDAAPETYVVSNNAGTATTGAIAFSLAGVNPTNFRLVFAGDASFPGFTCVQGQTLAAGASCTIGVLFNPHELGDLTTSVIAQANPGGTATSSHAGTGTHALVNVTSSPVTFTAAAPPSPGSSQTITFRNDAEVPTSLLQTTLTQGQNFEIVSDTCGGRSLPANLTCNIIVQFIPAGSAGPRSATLQIQGVVTGTTTTASVTLNATVN